VKDKSIFGFHFAIMREMDYNFRIHKNFWWNMYFHHIFFNKITQPFRITRQLKIEKNRGFY
jgi:hypothetical protein